MRRGHPGHIGWRSDNPRHFRPRIGGIPHYRPPRNYSPIETNRFPQPNARLHRGARLPYNRPHNPTEFRPEPRSRDDFRFQNELVSHRQDRNRHNQRYNYQNTRSRQNDHISNFYTFDHINSMGDIDDRQRIGIGNQPLINTNDGHRTENHQQPFGPWVSIQENHDKRNADNRSQQNKLHRQNINDLNKIPQADYSDHRPPASDHYGTATATTGNSNAFSRSVDSTVNMVRKCLPSRNDKPPIIDEPQEQSRPQTTSINTEREMYQDQEQTRKIIPIQKQNMKSNCDKLKNKIVHQLFKMDKDRIHKLMDNRSSSAKFEYAISSLITESQISLNQQVRSVAEKSLCSSSTEFIHNDNNTIYEDTFMKQMQCILDPQDNVLLEDIKPIVMAELSRVLQLEDQSFEVNNEKSPYLTGRNSSIVDQYSNSYSKDTELNYTHDQYSHDINIPRNARQSNDNLTLKDSTETHSEDTYDQSQLVTYDDTKLLFERRPPKQYQVINETKTISSDSQHLPRQSIELKFNEDSRNVNNESQLPLFDSNTAVLLEDDDPFAELDNQYHVAVDHNFIGADDPSLSHSPKMPTRPRTPTLQVHNQNDEFHGIENNDQLHISAKSPIKFSTSKSNHGEDKRSIIKPDIKIKLDSKDETTSSKSLINQQASSKLKQLHTSDVKHTNKEKIESSSSTIKSSINTKERQRSADQSPSHRKEKRKKSDTNQCDAKKQVLNKNIIINANDHPAKSSDKAEISHGKSGAHGKSCKDKSSTNTEKINLIENHPDKYNKKKDLPKKSKESSDLKKDDAEIKKKHNFHSSSNTELSPKENINNNSIPSESKTKLKSIDMFLEPPKKVVTTHKSNRNTAPVSTAVINIPKSNRKQKIRHIGTQVIKCVLSKTSQTTTKKLSTKCVQTDPVCFEETQSTDTLERMKEIDSEIQMLLQEKFNLYNSLDSKDSSSMPALGMTVLNVTKETDISEDMEDAIVNDFTNIPIEELEQIAFESVKLKEMSPKISQENQNQAKKRSHRTISPNISLIEQIITDDRPLEDIISLDDFETLPRKIKKKNPNPTTKKKAIKKKTAVNYNIEKFNIKQCFVKLIKEDLSNYNKINTKEDYLRISNSTKMPTERSVEATEKQKELTNFEKTLPVETNYLEEIVNDIQFDMLDVSEDIVIGESCEISKDDDRVDLPISEDIILDNSQSSAGDIAAPDVGQHSENQCRLFDFMVDESLKRESITVTGNADSVLAIECVESNFIAACLDGNVYYFRDDGQLISTFRGSNLAVTCLTIVKEKDGITFYTGSLDSRIRYYDLETGLEKGPECNVLSPIQTMDRAWDTVFVGTRTGFVLQFECKNNMLIPVSSIKFSEQCILVLKALKEGPRKVLLVAARFENVTIKDAQTGLLLRTLEGPKMTVYSLLYEDGKVYCGTSSNQIYVFNYSSGSHVGSHTGGNGVVCLRSSGGLIFTGCYDGCVYVYKEGVERPFAQLRGPSVLLLSLAIIGTKIIAGYNDRSLYVWQIPFNILHEMIL